MLDLSVLLITICEKNDAQNFLYSEGFSFLRLKAIVKVRRKKKLNL